MWSNWLLATSEKLHRVRLGSLLMMEFKSLVNPTVWNFLWHDKDKLVSYIWEDESVTIFCEDRQLFVPKDSMWMLSVNQKLRLMFLVRHMPCLVATIEMLKEPYYVLLDISRQVNILLERLIYQLNLHIKPSNLQERHNYSRRAINVTGVCQDTQLFIVGKASL